MKQSNGGYSPSYNVQVTTDSQEKIIVGVRVSQAGNDYGELVPSIEEAKQNTRRSPEQVVVDGGYISAANVMSMHQKQMELIGPLPDNTAKTAGLARTKTIDPAFKAEKFIYDPGLDRYTCPLGETLRYAAKQTSRGDMQYIYKSDPTGCATCKSKQQCCGGSTLGIRSITRKERLPIMADFEQRMTTDEAREIYKQRSAVAEFPNLWLKEKFRARRFKLRGLAKVRIETLWLCLTYNVVRWIQASSPVTT
jgi:transposase